MGMGSGASCWGGLNLTDSHNVIVRNLTIARAAGTDAVTCRARATSGSITDLSSESDGEDDGVDDAYFTSRATPTVLTVSWTRLHDHRDATGGHAVDNGDEDCGHLDGDVPPRFCSAHVGGGAAGFGTAHVFNHYADIRGLRGRRGRWAPSCASRGRCSRTSLPFTTCNR